MFSLSIRRLHVYRHSYKSPTQLEEYLLKSLLYNKHGIVVLNKPVGISYSQGTSQADTMDPTAPQLSLQNSLNHIKNQLGIKNLFTVKIPERNISGITIFANYDKLADKVRRRLNRMRMIGEPSDTYKAIVLGRPQKDSGFYSGAMKLEEKGKQKKVIFINEWSNNALKKGEIKKVLIKYRTLATQDVVSLVEVSSTRTKWHCVRAFLASQLLTPILGDDMYGSWVKTILGSPVPVDIFSQAASKTQDLPSEVKRTLQLESQKVKVPLHLHLSSVGIQDLLKDGFLFLEAPPPHVFLWTCQKLSLISHQEENVSLLSS